MAVLGLVVGATLLVVAFSRPTTDEPAAPLPVTSTAPTSAPVPHRRPASSPAAGGVEDRVAGTVLPSSTPTRLSIPRLHVVSPLESLGQDADGQMQVPVDPSHAGWYRNGPTPGALGPAVIAGHVTWNRVPAVFAQLSTLRPGDLVRVDRADHRVATFQVTRVAQYAKSRFPTALVYGSIDHAGLRLITCGGAYDDADHRYVDNVVVFASLVSGRRDDG